MASAVRSSCCRQDDQTQHLPILAPKSQQQGDLSTDLVLGTSANTAPTEMPPVGRPRPSTPKRDADLSGLLSLPERTELVTLVIKITDGMQNQLTQLFDPTASETEGRSARPEHWAPLPGHLRDISFVLKSRANNDSKTSRRAPHPGKENVNPTPDSNAGFNSVHGNSNASVEAMSATSPAQPAGSGCQELKKEAVLYFKKWQATVHKRVGDISVKRPIDPNGGMLSSASAAGNSKPSAKHRQQGQSRFWTVSAPRCHFCFEPQQKARQN